MVSVSVFKNTLFFYPLMFIVLNYATLIQVTQLLAVSFTEIQCYFSFSEFTLHLSNRESSDVTRFARLLSIEGKQVAHTLHLRFVTLTGDAMGMNMVSKVSNVMLCFLFVNLTFDMNLRFIS